MNIELLREYSLQKLGAMESFPFGEETLVLKVGEKIFLLISLEKANQFNAKCDPERVIELCEQYEEISPGFHMNKKHWITVKTDGFLSNHKIFEIIDHSYDLVFGKLPIKTKQEISGL